MGSSDSPTPIPPHFVSFAWRYRSFVRNFRHTPPGQDRCADLELFVTGAPFLPVSWIGDDGVSQVPGGPPVHVPCSLTPEGPSGQAISARMMLPSTVLKASAPSMNEISGLNDTARALAVYASQGGSPHHHARLASGCWPALPGGVFTHRVPLRSFRRASCHLLPPRPGFAWRTRTDHRGFVPPGRVSETLDPLSMTSESSVLIGEGGGGGVEGLKRADRCVSSRS